MSPAATPPLAHLHAVAKSYVMGPTAVDALRQVDLHIALGERLAIVGPSGSGKSTLMNILGLLDQPSGGTYSFCGEDTAALSLPQKAAIRNRRIGFVFQQFHLLDHLSAEQNVELPLLYGGMASPQRRARVRHYLHAVGLGQRRTHRPAQLSGGERQRVALARAIAAEPSMLLADEPTGALDSVTGAAVLDLVLDLCDRHGITLVVVTHDAGVAARMPRRIRMRDGAIEDDDGRAG